MYALIFAIVTLVVIVGFMGWFVLHAQNQHQNPQQAAAPHGAAPAAPPAAPAAGGHVPWYMVILHYLQEFFMGVGGATIWAGRWARWIIVMIIVFAGAGVLMAWLVPADFKIGLGFFTVAMIFCLVGLMILRGVHGAAGHLPFDWIRNALQGFARTALPLLAIPAALIGLYIALRMSEHLSGINIPIGMLILLASLILTLKYVGRIGGAAGTLAKWGVIAVMVLAIPAVLAPRLWRSAVRMSTGTYNRVLEATNLVGIKSASNGLPRAMIKQDSVPAYPCQCESGKIDVAAVVYLPASMVVEVVNEQTKKFRGMEMAVVHLPQFTPNGLVPIKEWNRHNGWDQERTYVVPAWALRMVPNWNPTRPERVVAANPPIMAVSNPARRVVRTPEPVAHVTVTEPTTSVPQPVVRRTDNVYRPTPYGPGKDKVVLTNAWLPLAQYNGLCWEMPHGQVQRGDMLEIRAGGTAGGIAGFKQYISPSDVGARPAGPGWKFEDLPAGAVAAWTLNPDNPADDSDRVQINGRNQDESRRWGGILKYQGGEICVAVNTRGGDASGSYEIEIFNLSLPPVVVAARE